MDCVASWALLLIGMIWFCYQLFVKAVDDFEARKKEAEEFWENYHR